jgi:hypothetical protein
MMEFTFQELNMYGNKVSEIFILHSQQKARAVELGDAEFGLQRFVVPAGPLGFAEVTDNL